MGQVQHKISQQFLILKILFLILKILILRILHQVSGKFFTFGENISSSPLMALTKKTNNTKLEYNILCDNVLPRTLKANAIMADFSHALCYVANSTQRHLMLVTS